MSTKLYDGILITEPLSWKIIREIRENIEQTFEQLNRKLTIEYFNEEYARTILKPHSQALETYKNPDDKEEDHGLYFNALQRFKKEESEFFKNKLLCKVHLFEPVIGANSEKAPAYVINNNEPEYLNNLLKLPYIKEYGYWNNTDKPDELTEEEWDERRSDWNEVLDRNFFFTGSGISIDLPETKTRTFLMPEEKLINVLNTAENLNSIREKISTRILSDLIFNRNKEAIDESLKSGSVSLVMEVISNSQKVIQETDVLPIGEVSELSIETLLEKDCSNIPVPVLDKEVLEELAEDERLTELF